MLEQHEPKIYAPIATNSTIPRDIRDRFADILNVKDYGAVGDGNTNDTQSFKNAKSAANTKNTVVYVPYGTYKITENIADNQSDISANAHTFLTDGHVTITGGGSVNVLDLSKALTRENGGLSVDNINNNGPIYLNSNSKLDFREGNGLVRVTNEDNGKQYITIKPKTNGGIVVDSGGISIDTSKIPVSAPITNTNGTIGFNPGTNSPITVTSGKLGLSVGTGLEVTDNGVLNCTVSPTEALSYTAGNGINITSNTIAAKVDNSTIGFDDATGALKSLIAGANLVVNTVYPQNCYVKKYKITDNVGFIDCLMPYWFRPEESDASNFTHVYRTAIANIFPKRPFYGIYYKPKNMQPYKLELGPGWNLYSDNADHINGICDKIAELWPGTNDDIFYRPASYGAYPRTWWASSSQSTKVWNKNFYQEYKTYMSDLPLWTGTGVNFEGLDLYIHEDNRKLSNSNNNEWAYVGIYKIYVFAIGYYI